MSSWRPLALTFLFLFLFSIANASVPASNTFKYVNQGEFGDYVVEYQANYRVLNVFTFPFQLCFYNTTPNTYTLALRMGTVRSESLMRWVWEANRGNPVGENATFSLGKDGNLVLAHANGRVAWQSGTANKGVVGFKLLPNGNMVLHDSKGKFIWQSFDFPTDTILVGQSLRAAGGPKRLVSRASRTRNVNGDYCMELEAQKLVLKSKKSPLKSKSLISTDKGTLEYLTFTTEPRTNSLRVVYGNKLGNSASKSAFILSKPGFNATLTYFRLGIDGSLKAYTYDTRTEAGSWKETFTFYPFRK